MVIILLEEYKEFPNTYSKKNYKYVLRSVDLAEANNSASKLKGRVVWQSLKVGCLSMFWR